MAEQQLYINGGYTSATSGRTFETINPANGEVLATGPPGAKTSTAP
jgi:betaine-aldehyde dehydrogenase